MDLSIKGNALFVKTIREAEEAIERGDFKGAFQKFTEGRIIQRNLSAGNIQEILGAKNSRECLLITVRAFAHACQALNATVESFIAAALFAPDLEDARAFLGRASGVAEACFDLVSILKWSMEKLTDSEEDIKTRRLGEEAINNWGRVLIRVTDIMDQKGLTAPTGLIEMAKKEGLIK
ncbi:MAG: hypothetical protein ACTSSA_10470 [Candidatus Freyarchaeota archaeon]|nr:hypothetical protein [Candidatus Freyarchaeota archaeon]